MNCQKCNSERVLEVSGKTSDMCCMSLGNSKHDGYVDVQVVGNGSGDYLSFKVCLECGQLQGEFPARSPAWYIPPSLEEFFEKNATELVDRHSNVDDAIEEANDLLWESMEGLGINAITEEMTNAFKERIKFEKALKEQCNCI